MFVFSVAAEKVKLADSEDQRQKVSLQLDEAATKVEIPLRANKSFNKAC